MLISEVRMNVTLLFCLVATVTQLISFVIPGWLIIELDRHTFYTRENYAVWYLTRCNYSVFATSSTCRTMSYVAMRESMRKLGNEDDDLRYAYATFLEWEIEVTSGLLGSALATIILFKLRRRNNEALAAPDSTRREPSGAMFGLAAAFAVIAGLLYIIPSIRLGQIYNTLSKISVFTSVDTFIPYGLIVGVFGGVMAFICFLSILLIFCNKAYRNESRGTLVSRDQYEGQAIPMLPIQGQQEPHPGYARPLPPPYIGYHNVPQTLPQKHVTDNWYVPISVSYVQRGGNEPPAYMSHVSSADHRAGAYSWSGVQSVANKVVPQHMDCATEDYTGPDIMNLKIANDQSASNMTQMQTDVSNSSIPNNSIRGQSAEYQSTACNKKSRQTVENQHVPYTWTHRQLLENQSIPLNRSRMQTTENRSVSYNWPHRHTTENRNVPYGTDHFEHLTTV